MVHNKGARHVKEYVDEGLSGTLSREKRPSFNAMIKDGFRKKFDTVVCWDISRIGRSMKELIMFLSDMKDRGIGICSVRQGFDTSTSMGEIMFQFVGILSSWEREMIRERTLAGLDRAKKEGKTLGRKTVIDDDKVLSSPLVMYHFVAEFLAPVVSYLMTDEAGCDCTV